MPERIVAEDIFATSYRLNNLILGPDGFVYGTSGNTFFRIVHDGNQIEPLASFADPIVGAHVTSNSVFIVSTDRNYWDPNAPCMIYVSGPKDFKFEVSKEIQGGCALSWSISSDKMGNIFLGEYGPRENDLSKTVWRSSKSGERWVAVFNAEDLQVKDLDRTHIHRVAIDPFTDNLWVTVGDGKENRGVYRSADQGLSWTRIIDSQATGIAFSADAIFLGEDVKTAEITRFDRETEKTKREINLSKEGNYGGSIYDLLIGASGSLFAPTMKYPDQSHIASVWAKISGEWQLLLEAPSEEGKGVGLQTIAGPDQNGWIYVPGYKIRDR